LCCAARAGDLVTFIADDSTHPTRLRGLEEIRRPVAKGPRAIALGGSPALICLLAAAPR